MREEAEKKRLAIIKKGIAAERTLKAQAAAQELKKATARGAELQKALATARKKDDPGFQASFTSLTGLGKGIQQAAGSRAASPSAATVKALEDIKKQDEIIEDKRAKAEKIAADERKRSTLALEKIAREGVVAAAG
jgi:cell division septum initiation protein DivIVA